MIESGKKEAQSNCHRIFINQVKKASNDNSKLIILADNNKSTLDTNKTNYIYNIELKKSFQDMFLPSIPFRKLPGNL